MRHRVAPGVAIVVHLTGAAVLAAAPDDAEARLQAFFQAGRFQDAARLVESWREPGPLSPRDVWRLRDLAALVAIAARDWPTAIDAATIPATADWGALTAFEVADLGLRAARAAWPGGRPEPLTTAHAAADVLEARATVMTKYLQALVFAAIAAAQEERDLVALSLRQAIALEAQLAPAGQPPAALRTDRVAGDLWLQVHRYADARDASLHALAADAADARSVIALARAQRRLDQPADAAEAYRRFLELWAHADADRAELAEARQFVQPR